MVAIKFDKKDYFGGLRFICVNKEAQTILRPTFEEYDSAQIPQERHESILSADEAKDIVTDLWGLGVKPDQVDQLVRDRTAKLEDKIEILQANLQDVRACMYTFIKMKADE